MLKRLIKLLVSTLVWAADALSDLARRIIGRRARPRAVVLYYHSVRPGLRAAFARQMDLLRRLARPWNMEQEWDSSVRRWVAVTFDDGYASVVENALPELKSRGIPFSIFFPTGSWNNRPGWVSNPSHPFFRERVLSRAELQSLATEPLVRIGSHSVNHPNLCQLDAAAAARELAGSRRELEALLSQTVDLFSFPHGAHNDSLVKQAQDAGYRRVFTVEPQLLDPSSLGYVVGRVAVEPDDWSLEFRLKLLGAYRWLVHRG